MPLVNTRVHQSTWEAFKARYPNGSGGSAVRACFDDPPQTLDTGKRCAGRDGVRDARVPVLVSAQQLEALHTLARDAGLTPTEYAARCVEWLAFENKGG